MKPRYRNGSVIVEALQFNQDTQIQILNWTYPNNYYLTIGQYVVKDNSGKFNIFDEKIFNRIYNEIFYLTLDINELVKIEKINEIELIYCASAQDIDVSIIRGHYFALKEEENETKIENNQERN
jgi:hypothetical protein